MHLRGKRIEAAQALIRYLANNEVTAVICGGYARDTICDKPIRDVDLYVGEHNWLKAYNLFDKECEPVLEDDSDPRVSEDSPEYMHQSIRTQLEFMVRPDSFGVFGLETNRINLIGLKDHTEVTVDEVIGRYNFGICKAGIDSERISIDQDFKGDYKQGMITLLRTDWGHEASMKQWLKLQDKYPWPMRLKITPTWEQEL